MTIPEIISQMTLEEKAALLDGGRFLAYSQLPAFGDGAHDGQRRPARAAQGT